MPFQTHPEFAPPSRSDARIWRYIDIAKFLSLLERASLFFVRLDKLAADDPFEGHYADANRTADNAKYEDLDENMRAKFPEREAFEGFIRSLPVLRKAMVNQHAGTFVNSWHLQEHESAAMWSQYIRSADGIAIQSSYQRLIDSLSLYEAFNVHIGLIQYLDYSREAIPMGNGFTPMMRKRKSFEHEKELRAVIWTYENGKNNINENIYRDTLGLYVPVDLHRLIESIYISPAAPHWVNEVIEGVSRRYSLKAPIRQSDLARQPIY